MAKRLKMCFHDKRNVLKMLCYLNAFPSDQIILITVRCHHKYAKHFLSVILSQKHTDEEQKGKSMLRKDDLESRGCRRQYDAHHLHLNIINTHLPQSDDLKHNVCVDKNNTNTHTANLISGCDHGSFKKIPQEK